jgi:hypothetical protein
MSMRRVVVALVALAAPARASAAQLLCPPAERGTTTLDGLTDEWTDVEGLEVGGEDTNRSFRVKCSVEGPTLYLLVDVRDNYLVRTKDARPGEDHLELHVGRAHVRIFPGDAAKLPTRLLPPAVAKGWRVASALQERGWAVELGIPLQRVGHREGAPQIPFGLAFADCDSKAQLKTEGTLSIDGQIAFAEGDAAMTGFLSTLKLKAADVFWDRPAALGRKSGARLVMAGHYLAAITDGYTYLDLPFKDRKDLKEARLIDLAGDGRQALVMRYLERGSGGAREVLAVYRVVGDQEIRRVFAAEVAKAIGPQRLDTKVTFLKRKRATDIQIDAAPPTGFTQASYREAEAGDMIPIPLPWADERRAVYQFVGDEYSRSK